jgi:hypothetical protein
MLLQVSGFQLPKTTRDPELDRRKEGQFVSPESEPEHLDLGQLDLLTAASQTHFMAQTYLLFDFGTNEEKAQLARHKLEGWKQAFRLDKKLLYKFDRETGAAEAPKPESKAELPKVEKPKTKGKAKLKGAEAAPAKEAEAANGKVSLLVRLYFSSHEKLSEQRWVGRIPTEEPFKDASPRVVHEGEAQFDEVVKQFDLLD